MFSTCSIKKDEFYDLIKFDQIHLLDAMKKNGIAEYKCAPPLNYDELLVAYIRGDILRWIFSDGNLAGYMWREKRSDCLFGAGLAIKQEFYGKGLCQYVINITEKLAKESDLVSCQLAVIPENGRVINAYLKQGYKIVKCTRLYSEPQNPGKFRCIMQKNLKKNSDVLTVIDRIEAFCVDEEHLMQLTIQGYVGTAYKRNESLNESKIIFEKYIL